jgi:hypothetical protein
MEDDEEGEAIYEEDLREGRVFLPSDDLNLSLVNPAEIARFIPFQSDYDSVRTTAHLMRNKKCAPDQRFGPPPFESGAKPDA